MPLVAAGWNHAGVPEAQVSRPGRQPGRSGSGRCWFAVGVQLQVVAAILRGAGHVVAHLEPVPGPAIQVQPGRLFTCVQEPAPTGVASKLPLTSS